MITFSCSSCREKFSVDDNMSGQMGKCPHCGNMMRVPTRSTNIFQIFQKDAYFSDKHLNSLYVGFLKANENLIVSQNLENQSNGEQYVILELRTTGRRTQIVVVDRYEVKNTAFLAVASRIGEIKYNETAVKALRSVNVLSMYTISLDNDNELWVSSMRLLPNMTQAEFNYAVTEIANFADAMEKDIFGSDTE